MDDLNEAMIVQNQKNADDTNGLLETIITQNEKNNPQPELEAMIEQGSKTQKTIEESSSKVADAVKELKPAMDAAGFIANFMQAIKGDKGDDGYNPEKGKDYFTDQEIKDISSDILEKATPKKGKDYFDGDDGYTPVKGKDYFTPKELREIISSCVERIPVPKDGLPGEKGEDAVVDYDKIIKDVVKKLPKIKKQSEKSVEDIAEQLKGKLSYDDLKDLPYAFKTSARDYDFIELKDAPKSYVGQGGKVVAVKADLSGLEFISPATGSGDVTGPASSTADNIAVFNGLTGKIIKDGGAKISDLATVASLASYIPYTGATTNINLGIHNLTVDTNTLFVDSVNHNVYVGSTTGTAKFETTLGATADYSLVGKFAGNNGFIGMYADDRTSFKRMLLKIENTVAPSETLVVFASSIVGETYSRFGFTSLGKLLWGVGGASDYDTNLYRSAANVLRTSNSLIVDGNLGIGTATPTAKVEIVSSGASGTTPDLATYRYSNDSVGVFHASFKARGTLASPSAVQSGDTLGGFFARGYHSGGAFPTANTVGILFRASENYTATANGTEIVLATTPNGSTTRVDRVTISNSGNVIISDIGASASTATPTTLSLGSTFGDSVANSFKLKVFENNVGSAHGFGVSTSQFNYFVNGTTADHVFNVYNAGTPIELMRIKGTGNLAIGQATAPARLTISEDSATYSQISASFDMALGIAVNTAIISGLDFKNFNSGGQVRFLARNDQDDYIVMNSFGSAAAGTLFGQNRTDLFSIFTNGGVDADKKLAIGTLQNADFILGTNNLTRVTITGAGVVSIQNLTASELIATDASKNLVSLAVATYPSLTELTYVKGVTSAIQTQLSAKAPSASPTFTGTVTLPKTLEIQDTSADHQYILAVNELTTDRTVTLPLLTGNDEFVFKDHTQTLTNKTITQRVITTTDDATAVIDVTLTDTYELSAVANATTFSTTGTPVDGQKIMIRFKDAGVAKGLTWDAIFVAIGVTLPTTTVAGKWHYVGGVYNSSATKFHILAVGVEA